MLKKLIPIIFMGLMSSSTAMAGTFDVSKHGPLALLSTSTGVHHGPPRPPGPPPKPHPRPMPPTRAQVIAGAVVTTVIVAAVVAVVMIGPSGHYYHSHGDPGDPELKNKSQKNE
jgi:hypothetical protein